MTHGESEMARGTDSILNRNNAGTFSLNFTIMMPEDRGGDAFAQIGNVIAQFFGGEFLGVTGWVKFQLAEFAERGGNKMNIGHARL